MNKYISLLVCAGALTFAGCQDFLEEKQVTTLTQDFYKSPEGLETLVKGTYQILRYKPDYNPGNYVFGINSDVEVFAWSDANRVANGGYAPGAWNAQAGTSTNMNSQLMALIGQVSGGVSEGCYPVINRCNIFLENYATLSDADKKKMEGRRGEILFLRTYAYFILSNTFGAVPIMTKSVSGMPENFYYPKGTLEELYTMLINDMKEAVEILPATTGDLGRITKPAAATFLAKLFLVRAQGAEFQNSSEPTLKALYKGTDSGDLDNAIKYATVAITQKQNETAYGGLAPDFGSLWTDIKGSDPYARDKVSELLLTAQYESTQTYNGRYGSNTSFIHLYNSNHTNFRASVGRTMEYGRPFATAGSSDWGYDMYTDRANDSRYYKTYLTDYVTTQMGNGGYKDWTATTAYVYNNFIKGANDATVKAGEHLMKSLGQRAIVYIENSKDEPLDSLWVASQPFIMNVRWTVGAPNGNYGTAGSYSSEVEEGLRNPVVKNKGTRKLYYRVDGDKGDNYGLDYGLTQAGHYMGPRKWLDINRGLGTSANGGQAIDICIFRLAETYLIRAEAYGRKGDMTNAIADLNVLRKRAAYHAGETRNEVLVKYEPSVLTGKLDVPSAEKQSPYKVTADSYEKIKVTGEEWTAGTDKFKKENYPDNVNNYFVQFIYNERARELIFELNIREDLHNAGILYERVVARDQLGAPATSKGTQNFPFPKDDVSTGSKGATGVGKGVFERKHTFFPWPQAFLDLLTDEKGNALDEAAKKAYQNYGY